MDVLQEDDFESHRKKGPTREHVLVPSAEVTNANISKFPWLASCYYRAVVQSPSSSEWHLTGIDTVLQSSALHLIAPRNKNTARLCSRKRVAQYDNALFTEFDEANIHEAPPSRRYRDRNIGYMFHVHCWEVLGHLLGHEVIEKNLVKVISAVRQYWYWRTPRYMELSMDERLGVMDMDTSFRANEWDKVAYAKYPEYAHGCDIHRSPWVVPEVQNIIKLARAQRRDRKSPDLNKLPLEICLLVLDIICPLDFTQRDVQSTSNMLSVFVLNVPEFFWRSRLQANHDLFFEVDCVRDHDSLDWQCLWLGLMDLLADHTWFISSG
ncbi:hypothetical protein N7520_011373 [Penicillium odoratum]|uniref:uncharacterized protein n=1 Tax=Penicillium odoratum TaxID=1167516 RepID=UPI0025469910|nr:uncharacterized protein N7520_011373 [Penicillium odoratum]KAJ5746191.1 hypothetical protein N7520_011373 [Penicillium odoratum]